jgi:hypothetical protein
LLKNGWQTDAYQRLNVAPLCELEVHELSRDSAAAVGDSMIDRLRFEATDRK